jgi:hypothetical protein
MLTERFKLLLQGSEGQLEGEALQLEDLLPFAAGHQPLELLLENEGKALESEGRKRGKRGREK